MEGKRDVLGRGVVDVVGWERETGGEGEGGSSGDAEGKHRTVGRGPGESAAGHEEKVGGTWLPAVDAGGKEGGVGMK